MPQTDIAYDNPYNRKLVALLREMDEKHSRLANDSPDMFADRLANFHGAKIGGGSHADQKFVAPGNSGAYPPAHFHNGMCTSSRPHGGYSIQDALNVAREAAPIVLPALMGLGESGGRLARAKSIARRVKRGRETMFEGLPAAPPKRKGRLAKGSPEAKAWHQEMMARKNAARGGSEATATEEGGRLARATSVARRVKRGRKTMFEGLPDKNVGGSILSNVLDIARPIATSVAKDLGRAVIDKGANFLKDKLSGGSSDKRKERAEIVKRIMKEKGLKMIEASKYVKAHGLY